MPILKIQDVPNEKLKLMLKMKNFQDKDSQKMIKDEIKFRRGMSFEDMTRVFQGKPKKFRR